MVNNIGLLHGNNLYQYCFNNPIQLSDPTGYIALVDDATLLLAAGVIFLVGFAITSVMASNHSSGSLSLSPGLTLPQVPAIPRSPGAIAFAQPKAQEKSKSVTDSISLPKTKDQPKLPSAVFKEALCLGDGNGIAILPGSFSAKDAEEIIKRGGDVWTYNASDAIALAVYMSGGYYGPHTEAATGNCAHVHLKNKRYGGAHLFYGLKGCDFISAC